MAAQARGAVEGRPLTAKAVIEHVHEQVPHRDELVLAVGGVLTVGPQVRPEAELR